MNRRCYCSTPLQYDDDVPALSCKSCCRDLVPGDDKAVYTCFKKGNCIYWKMNRYYYVCSDCYEEDKDDIKSDLVENDMKFVLKKFMHSISSIS